MINFKQQELIENFVGAVEERFPDVKFVDVTESPENPNDLWINVTRVRDEDRLIDLLDFCSEKSTDILMDYGYHNAGDGGKVNQCLPKDSSPL